MGAWRNPHDSGAGNEGKCLGRLNHESPKFLQGFCRNHWGHSGRAFRFGPCYPGDHKELLTRPVGRSSQKPLVRSKSFLHQAASWKTARRVVAKVEFHSRELFPRVGFMVTNLEVDSRAVVRFYNKRGTAEQWIKEGKQAVKMTRLSCHRFRSNEVQLWLSLIAYNLGNLWRRLVLPKRIDNWSLTSLQQRLVKTGGRLLKHARYYWLLLAESHLTRRLFGAMVQRMAALTIPTG